MLPPSSGYKIKAMVKKRVLWLSGNGGPKWAIDEPVRKRRV
jgi:hypothetical protein